MFDDNSRRYLRPNNQYDLQKTVREILENLTQLRSDFGRVYSNVVD